MDISRSNHFDFVFPKYLYSAISLNYYKIVLDTKINSKREIKNMHRDDKQKYSEDEKFN